MIVKPIKTRIFKEGEDLLDFISHYFKKIPERSVIVVTSKIVSLSEKRTAVIENAKTKERLIKAESDFAIPTKYVWLTVKDNMAMASAGIDESNANGKLILLPKDSYATAEWLCGQLKKRYKLKNLGILITDSRTMPFRAGVTGVSLGYAGFEGVIDYRETPDLFGRKFHFSRTDVADGLAAAAVLVMGEGRERQPLASISGAPIRFCKTIKHNELDIDIRDDMYRPLFEKLPKPKNRL